MKILQIAANIPMGALPVSFRDRIQVSMVFFQGISALWIVWIVVVKEPRVVSVGFIVTSSCTIVHDFGVLKGLPRISCNRRVRGSLRESNLGSSCLAHLRIGSVPSHWGMLLSSLRRILSVSTISLLLWCAPTYVRRHLWKYFVWLAEEVVGARMWYEMCVGEGRLGNSVEARLNPEMALDSRDR